jgi:hypothetical protein
MRKLTDRDLTAIIGTEQSGYTIQRARVKDGEFSDSDHYGIALARSESGRWVTWQFHLDADEKPDFYWGRYITDPEAAEKDYEIRGTDQDER